MKTMASLLVLTIAGVSLAPAPVGAGAWSQAKGHYYAKLSGIYYSSDEVYNDMGMRQAMGGDGDEFTGSQGFLYLEYGLLDRLTVVGTFSGGLLKSMNILVEKETTGFGDFDIGAKYQLVDGPVVLSPFVTVKVPTGYHEDYDPPLGTGDPDLEFRLLAARSLYPLPLYVSAESGYRIRGGPYSNQIPYLLEVGGTPHPRVFVKGYVDGKNTQIASIDDLEGVVGGSVQVSEGNFTKLGVNGAYNLAGPLWVDLLAERTIRGENIGAGVSWGLGISYSY